MGIVQDLFFTDIVLLMPEFFFVTSLLFLLPLGVSYNHVPISVNALLGNQILKFTFVVLIYFSFLIFNFQGLEYSFFSGQYTRDALSYGFIFLSILGVASLCVYALLYFQYSSLSDFEVPLIFLLVLGGNLFIILSNDFLSVYVGIELQSLGLYILSTFKNNSTFSTEAGLKYFVLGAFASSLLLFGICLFYGFTGSIQFTDAFLLLMGTTDNFNAGLGCTLFFLFSGLLFKLGAAPLHVWVPDVYEGSPTLITGFFSIVPKIGILFLLLKISFGMLYYFDTQIWYFISYSALLSILIGSLGALGQYKVKRLIAYSSIGHSGFFLLGLSSLTLESIVAISLYLFIYIVLLLNVFGVILGSLERATGGSIKFVSNLRYIYQWNPSLGLMLGISFFGIAGIPPLSGFFSKFFIFFSTLSNELYLLSSICIVVSVVGSIYYLRLIRSSLLIKNRKSWVFFYNPMPVATYWYAYTFILSISFMLFGEGLLYLLSEGALQQAY